MPAHRVFLGSVAFLLGALTLRAQDEPRFIGRITFTGVKMSAHALNSTGKHLVYGFNTGLLTILEHQPKKFVKIEAFPAHPKAVTVAAFSPDDKWVASAGADGTVKLWETFVIAKYQQDAVKRKEGAAKPPYPTAKRSFTAHPGGVNALSFSPDGSQLATCGPDGTIKVWNTDPAKLAYTIAAAHIGAVHAVAFAPDGNHLASAGADKTAKIWKAAAVSKPEFTLGGHEGPVLALAFSPDGQHLATGSGVPKKSGEIRVWNVETGKEESKFDKLDDVVTTLRYHPKLPRLASGGKDTMVRVWSTESKKQLYSDVHSAGLLAVTYSADGTRFGTICPEEAKVWQGLPKVSE